MSILATLFEKSIDQAHKINREDKCYVLTENKVPYKFKSRSKHSAGFRIEIEKLNLFAGSPPSGVAKMCDALFVVQHKNQDFVIAVEIKTNNNKKYKKQLCNGCRFCEWIVQLFEDHGHDTSGATQYLGLLVWHPNPNQPPKKTMLAAAKFEKIKAGKYDPMSNIYQCHNLQDIPLHNLIETATKS